MKSILFSAIIFLFFCSCEQNILTVSEFRVFIADEDNGLTRHIRKNGIDATLSYRPSELIIASNYRKYAKNKVVTDSIRKEYDRYLYFTLKLSNRGREIEHRFVHDQKAFVSTIQYLSGTMAQDIQLVTKNDTIPVADYIYPRMYGETGSSTIMFAFDRTKLQNSRSLQIVHQGSRLGLPLTNTFEFSMDDIQNLPKVDLLNN